MAIPALPGQVDIGRPDATGTLESVRALLDHLLVGVTEDGWRDLDPAVVQDCFGAPREFRSIAVRVALLADRARALEPR